MSIQQTPSVVLSTGTFTPQSFSIIPGLGAPLSTLKRGLGTFYYDTVGQSMYASGGTVNNIAVWVPVGSAVGLITKPVNSSVATAAFVSTLTAGTSVQNTNNYDIICNICIAVSAATTATITLGVGSATGPTTNTVIPSFSTATTILLTIQAYVPAGYYLVYNHTGTITIASVTVQAMGV